MKPNMRELVKAQSDAEGRRLREQIKALQARNSMLCESLASAGRARAVRVSPSTTKHKAGGFIRVIIPDTHGSAIDPLAAGAFLADLKQLNPSEIVMLGDHVDCGGFLAQHHVMGYVAETSYSYADDIASANDFLDKVQAAAPNAVIHYLAGNHCDRVEAWCVTQSLRHEHDCEMLRRALAPEFLLRLKDRGIKYYRRSEFYHGVRIPGAIKLGKCFFYHGSSTATHAASVVLNQFAGNVVFGHIHRESHFSSRPVSAGDIAAWCPGCLCKQQPLWQHTRPTNWTHGYAVQNVAASGDFLHMNIRIVDGRSLLIPLLKQRKNQ